MLTQAELAGWLDRHPSTTPDTVVVSPDKRTSISGQLVRAVWEGRLTVAVGSDVPSSAAAAALVDLVALQLATPDAPTGLTLLLADDRPEVLDAARTLRASIGDRADVSIRVAGTHAAPTVDHDPAPDFSSLKKAQRWAELLEKWRVADPPPLARRLLELVGHPCVRLYPMLSGNPVTGNWSLRLDGLEAARVSASGGVIDVGRTSGAGAVSPPRKRWLEVQPQGACAINEDNVEEAATLVVALIAKFPTDSIGVLNHGQPEHALESAVLRGLVPVATADAQLLPWLEDGLVSRGSQFPTLWTGTGRPRYLDALLKDGPVPWAIELKVLRSGGSGAYYRHGLAQAVLYRHFIQSAKPIHPWFEHAGTNAALCRAAVAFPKAPEAADGRITALRQLGQLFRVEVIELDAP